MNEDTIFNEEENQASRGRRESKVVKRLSGGRNTVFEGREGLSGVSGHTLLLRHTPHLQVTIVGIGGRLPALGKARLPYTTHRDIHIHYSIFLSAPGLRYTASLMCMLNYSHYHVEANLAQSGNN
jgi:hypothetical protein